MKREKDTDRMYTVQDDGTLAYLFFHTVRKLRHNGLPGYSRQKVLSILEEMGPLSQKKVQEILDIKPGSLSELCAKMESGGLIERTRDENDKRNVVIRITEKGREQRREIRDAKDDFLFASLSEEERNELRRILHKLSADAASKNDVNFVEILEEGKEEKP